VFGNELYFREGGGKNELSSRPEKFLQEFCALSRKNAAPHYNLVIERGVVQNMHRGMHRASFGVFSAIHQVADAGMHYGTCAHGARLNGHKKIAVCKAVIAEGRSGFAQSNYFRVGRRVGIGEVAVESASDNFAFMHDDGAYRHFSYVERSLSSTQGVLHPQFILFRTSAIPHEQYCMRMIEPSAFAQTD
jgi:hypothetical protein